MKSENRIKKTEKHPGVIQKAGDIPGISDAWMVVISAGQVKQKCILIICGWVAGG